MDGSSDTLLSVEEQTQIQHARTRTHTHARARTRAHARPHTRTHARPHACTHAFKHAHMHTHTWPPVSRAFRRSHMRRLRSAEDLCVSSSQFTRFCRLAEEAMFCVNTPREQAGSDVEIGAGNSTAQHNRNWTVVMVEIFSVRGVSDVGGRINFCLENRAIFSAAESFFRREIPS